MGSPEESLIYTGSERSFYVYSINRSTDFGESQCGRISLICISLFPFQAS
jgi:hypothetical protein